MFWVGIKEWLNVTMKYPIYNKPQDAANRQIKLIDIPFWKCSHHCYLDILLVTQCDEKDYPFEIGPFPCPLAWVSFMESTFQFSLNYHVLNHITLNNITSQYLVFI